MNIRVKQAPPLVGKIAAILILLLAAAVPAGIQLARPHMDNMTAKMMAHKVAIEVQPMLVALEIDSPATQAPPPRIRILDRHGNLTPIGIAAAFGLFVSIIVGCGTFAAVRRHG